jgi:Flp pilus assembly CpaF family ATPase
MCWFSSSPLTFLLHSDWKEVYIYRHTHYKQVSCVIVGDTNVGKKTLITAFEGAPPALRRSASLELCIQSQDSNACSPRHGHATRMEAGQ